MEKYYFIEALHTAGTSDEHLNSLIDILNYNKEWVNQFSNQGANPVLISIETGNVKMVDFLLNEFHLKSNVTDKILKSCLIIEDKEKQHEIFKIVLKKDYINKNTIFSDGKSLFNKLIVGSSKNISLIKKYKISFVKKDLYSKDTMFDILDNLTLKKIKNIEYILPNYTLDDLIDLTYNHKNLSDYIYGLSISEKIKSKAMIAINKYIQSIQN